jgi:hypothetical protein
MPSTWDVEDVWILDGVRQDDRSKITAKRFASGLASRLGSASSGKASSSK